MTSQEVIDMGVRADLEEKERALARLTSPGTLPGRYQPDDQLLAFLRSL